MSDWKHKDMWTREGKNFIVQVSRHSVNVEDPACYDSDHGQRWCVYAYIYPKHPHFAKFEGPNIWQDATSIMPLHAGCSLLKYPMYDGKVTSVHVGCDYNHLHDERFTQMKTQADAYSIFRDADELYDWLQERAK